ncbi:MAG: hypothetical protein IKM72_07775 [Oscillospiraceae bacterium]|nr:hypothetical protein [Oscillospiraceae bacterium]
MKIYMDMCCYNRPYDSQDQLKVELETKAKLRIQSLVQKGELELIGSYVLDYECSNIPSPMRKNAILDFMYRNIKGYVGSERAEKLTPKIQEIMLTNVKEYDASHVAAAIYAGCDYFISVDKRLLKYKTDEIRMVSPIDFILDLEMEE